MESDLGPKPEPQIEPGEPHPGGVDAIDGGGDTFDEPTVPDLDPDSNPAVEDAAPDEIKELDDTKQEGESDGASQPESEPPA